MTAQHTGYLIIGAGFAGASTAWALARDGRGPGLILEQEPAFGTHASGRNAALVKLTESDAIIRALVTRSRTMIRQLEAPDTPLVRRSGGFALASSADTAGELQAVHEALARDGVPSVMLSRQRACRDFPLLEAFEFDTALWSENDGVADIHALLTRFIELARDGGFRLRTNTRVAEVLVEAGRAVGVRTGTGEEIRAEVVVDASGAWAGTLAPRSRMSLTPMRRHLFVSAPVDTVRPDQPFAWHEDAALYFRPEGDGLLLSPCDETPMPAGLPPTDPAAAELLAEKLARVAPLLSDLAIRRHWACLRTFAPDRRPLIGCDPQLPGLFHVSGLGGFGMMCSAAIGEAAATLIEGGRLDWLEAAAISPARLSRREAGG